MHGRSLGLLALTAATLVHRAVFHLGHRSQWLDQLAANPDWLTMQFLPAESLLGHPFASLWYLQGMPPIPNVVVGVALRLVPSPQLLLVPLLALQALLTAAAAVLVVLVGSRWISAGWAWFLGILWAFSPDPVVIEATNFGQGFYENLTLVGLLLATWCACCWAETDDDRWLLWVGLTIALVALTRSSYAYLLLPLAPTVALLARGGPKRRLRAAALVLAVPLVVQGGWAVKNWWVFGHFTWPASTWAGASVAGSLLALGEGPALEQDIRAHLDEHPPWMERYLDAHGVDPWAGGWTDFGICPEAQRRSDQEVLRRLGDHNRHENTRCQRLVSEEFAVASARLLAQRPDLAWRKLRLGYALYWLPIRYHHYLGLVGTEWRVARSFRVWRTVGMLFRGELPEPHYLIGDSHRDHLEPASLHTLDLPAVIWWIVELTTIHLLTPVLVAAVVWRAWRRRRLILGDQLAVFVSMVVFYAAVVHNAAEFGENMRFRWNVEPLIWLLVAATLHRCTGLLQQTWRWRREAG